MKRCLLLSLFVANIPLFSMDSNGYIEKTYLEGDAEQNISNAYKIFAPSSTQLICCCSFTTQSGDHSKNILYQIKNNRLSSPISLADFNQDQEYTNVFLEDTNPETVLFSATPVQSSSHTLLLWSIAQQAIYARINTGHRKTLLYPQLTQNHVLFCDKSRIVVHDNKSGSYKYDIDVYPNQELIYVMRAYEDNSNFTAICASSSKNQAGKLAVCDINTKKITNLYQLKTIQDKDELNSPLLCFNALHNIVAHSCRNPGTVEYADLRTDKVSILKPYQSIYTMFFCNHLLVMRGVKKTNTSLKNKIIIYDMIAGKERRSIDDVSINIVVPIYNKSILVTGDNQLCIWNLENL